MGPQVNFISKLKEITTVGVVKARHQKMLELIEFNPKPSDLTMNRLKYVSNT